MHNNTALQVNFFLCLFVVLYFKFVNFYLLEMNIWLVLILLLAFRLLSFWIVITVWYNSTDVCCNTFAQKCKINFVWYSSTPCSTLFVIVYELLFLYTAVSLTFLVKWMNRLYDFFYRILIFLKRSIDKFSFQGI